MKRKIVTVLMLAALAITPVTARAEDDLEARISALEERVAALEAQLAGSVPEGVSGVPEQTAGEVPSLADINTGMVSSGSSLQYKRCEVGQDLFGADCVILYFEYINESGETAATSDDFYLKAYQHDIEIDSVVLEGTDWYTELRSGAAPIEVTYGFEISDTSDVIVNMSSADDYSMEPIEFTVSLE